MKWSQYLGVITLAVLAIIVVIIWVLTLSREVSALQVSFLDVGQGDSIFIQSPTGTQIIIDGGGGPGVIRRLSEEMPWNDRTIDMVVVTHPDADHISGLIDVLDRYQVATVVESSVEGDTSLWQRLQESIDAEGAQQVTAMRGQVFNIGGGAYLEVLFPDRSLVAAETNLASVVMRLVYGGTSVLLSGDSPRAIEEYMVSLDRERLKSTILKAGHHGSKTSTAPLYLGYVDPEYTIFSRGCDNAYGHPSKETITLLTLFDEVALDTCTEGTITFVSDGKEVSRK